MSDYSPFPKRILPDTEKGEEYTLAMAKAIYYNYDSGSDYVNKSIIDNFIENRKYGEGSQSEEKYTPYFSLEYDNKTNERKGLKNIDFSIVPFAPRLRNTTLELLSSRTNRSNVVFLNDIASNERTMKKLEMKADIDNSEFVGGINKMRGVETPVKESAPTNNEELKMIEEFGGIKLDVETALEMGIDYVFNYEMKWEDTIANVIKGNLFDNGIAVVSTYYDPVTESIRIKAHNIENIILDGASDYNFTDAQYFGEIQEKTVLDVYNEVKASTGRVLKESDLEALGLSRMGHNNNINSNWFDAAAEGTMAGLMPNRIQVLDFVYLSTDVISNPSKGADKSKVYINKEKISERELKSGKIKEDEKGYYKNVSNKKTIDIPVWRKGKWVINTDIVYDFGLVYNQVRDLRFRPIAPFFAVRLHGKSVIDIIKPNLDALQINMLNLQNLKTEMKGYGLAINFDALSNIKMGGQDYSVPKLLKLYKLKSTLLYKTTNSQHPSIGAQASPITELEGGMGRAYTELVSDIEFHIQQIQLNIGLNDVALAQNPNPEITYGQSQLAMSGANNAIAHIYKAYKYLKESVAYSIALRLHNIAKKNPNSKYSDIIGDYMWKALSKTDDNFIMKEGIKIMDNPSQEEIQMLYTNIAKLAPNSLSSYDLFLVDSLIKEGKPLKYIAAIMESKIRKREKEAMESKNMMMQNNAAQQQAMQQEKLQFESAAINAKAQADLMIQADKFDRQSKLDAENDIRENKLFGQQYRNNT